MEDAKAEIAQYFCQKESRKI